MVGSGDTGNPGMGLLAGYTHNPTTPTFQVGATNGLNWRYNSGSSANTVCGLWAPNTAGLQFANRTWHCSMRAKTRVLTGPTATRQYVGFTSRQGGRLPGSDSPIATDESAILIGWRTSDVSGSNPLIKVFTNSGAGSMTVQTTQVAPTTAVTQYAIDAVDANPTTGNPAWRVRVLSPSGTTTTSDQYFESNVPANGTPMVPVALYSTTSTNTNYDLYFLEMSQDQ
jgi:hypothetical protein